MHFFYFYFLQYYSEEEEDVNTCTTKLFSSSSSHRNATSFWMKRSNCIEICIKCMHLLKTCIYLSSCGGDDSVRIKSKESMSCLFFRKYSIKSNNTDISIFVSRFVQPATSRKKEEKIAPGSLISKRHFLLLLLPDQRLTHLYFALVLLLV